MHLYNGINFPQTKLDSEIVLLLNNSIHVILVNLGYLTQLSEGKKIQVKDRTKQLLDLGCNDRNYTNVLRTCRFKLCDFFFHKLYMILFHIRSELSTCQVFS